MTYAWFMVGITFLTQFVAMGITFYSATFFLVPLQQEFDTGATEVSLIGTAMSIGVAIVSPFVGRWVARHSIRNIMTLGCLAMGIGFLVGSRATDIWYLIALFATFVTFAMATMGGVTTQALVVNWFKEDRAMALGISLMGVSASGFVLPPITSALVEAGGWRWAYEVFGWACLCVTPIVYFSVVGRPEERSANGPDASARIAGLVGAPALSTREALRERNLWIISITSGLSFMVTSAIMLHIVPHAMKSGIDSSQGAYIIQAIAAGAMLAKVAFGWLARRIGELHALQVALAMQGLGTFGLNFAGDIAPMIGLACVLGTGLGGVMPLAAALLARAFGPAAFGPMMGLMTPIMIPFQAIGQPIAGAVVDFSGSYRMAWFGFTVVVLAAMAILAALRLPDDAPSELVPGAGHEGGSDSSVT